MQSTRAQFRLSLMMLVAGLLLWESQAHAQISYGSGLCTGLSTCIDAQHNEWVTVQQYGHCNDNGSYQDGGPNFAIHIVSECWHVANGWYVAKTAQLNLDQAGNIPPECDQGANPPVCVGDCDGTVTGNVFWRPGNSIGGADICNEPTGCKLAIVNKEQLGSSDLVKYVGTADSCAGETIVPDSQLYGAPQCISSGGDTWCTDGLASQNCGMLNGEYVCLGTISSGGCTFFGNGDLACDAGAGSPPAPDNGTPGQAATPTTTMTTGDGTTQTTVNVYSNTTVGASSGGVSGNAPSTQPSEPQEIDLSELTEIAQDPTAQLAQLESVTAAMESDADSVLAELADPDDFPAPSVTGGTTIKDGLAYSNCADIDFQVPGGGFLVSMPCSQLADLRDILGWVLRMLLAIYAFNLVMTKPTS